MPCRDGTIDMIFRDMVCLRPDAVAVTYGGKVLTYRALHAHAVHLALKLQAAGVVRGSLVAICADRSPEMIVGLLAIVLSGAAYVPLDPEYPTDRLEFMLADTAAPALLVQPHLVRRLPAGRARTVLLDPPGDAPTIPEEPAGAGSPDQPAYVMYTSGSTGTPKGVSIPHRGITRLVCEPDYVDISTADVFMQMAPTSFDASTFEIWGALLNGARLVMMPPGPIALSAIGETIRREGVTIAWLTGGLFNLMVDERLDALQPLKQLLIGGEALSVAHVEKALATLGTTQLINGYGPTENTTFTCCHRICRGEDFSRGVPIGSPIRGTMVKVVDEQLHEVAAGAEGELLAGGAGVALGYWNRPELTSERFVIPPSADSGAGVFYRTGDQVRMRKDGVVEFLGRRDQQVKLRGFRIELGEIEAAIRKHEGVRDCAVKIACDASGSQLIAAYVVPKEAGRLDPAELSAHAGRLLPEHMLPAAWTLLAGLPLNPNGKVDRAALPNPIFLDADKSTGQPTSELERVIGDVWKDILGGRSVGLDVSFFDAGGNSLQLTRLHERLGRERGIVVPLTDVFQYPSVRLLARHVAAPAGPSRVPAGAGGPTRATAQREALSRFRKPPMESR